MATSQPHQSTFPIRPYAPTLHGGSKLNERGAPTGFGTSSSHTNPRETVRFERERQERERALLAQQQAPGGGASNNMSQLSDEQKDEINEAFGLFDLDKDQLIDYHEFKVALKALGFDLPKPELLSLLTSHGAPKPSQQQPGQQQPQVPVPPSRLFLNLPAFQSIASALIANRDPREEILRAFDLFDTEGKGMISLDDLRRVARELGEGLEDDELVAMIEEFDLDGKGGVGREEFVSICMN